MSFLNSFTSDSIVIDDCRDVMELNSSAREKRCLIIQIKRKELFTQRLSICHQEDHVAFPIVNQYEVHRKN